MKSNVKNSFYMKFANRQQILNIIRKGPTYRAELSRQTGLTRAAVSLIVDELVKDGIVFETGIGISDYGRKPVLLDINPSCHYAIGLNISRNGCSAGIINIKGKLISKTEICITGISSAPKALRIIKKSIGKLVDSSEIQIEKFLGIGISCPGPLDVHSGRILNPPNFTMWHNVNIVDELKNCFPFNVYLENNSTALTLAEKNYGKGTQYNNFILLVVDTGVGAGIVINDKLYRGFKGFGSEIGHTTIDINGEPCDCGNTGCLEVYASIPSILKRFHLNDLGISSWKDVVNRAKEHDKTCIDVIDREAKYLAAGIINIVNVLEPDAVILTGYINYEPRILLNKLSDIVNGAMITRDIHKLTISGSSIIEDADIVSAAAIAVNRFFSKGW